MYRQLLVVGAAVAALSVSACSPKADETQEAAAAPNLVTPDADPAATIPTPSNEAAAPDFVDKAAASDMFEIEAARIAQKRAASAEVKAFAGEMIAAHQKTTAGLKQAIAESQVSLTPPAELPGDLRDRLADLNQAAASDFDKAYMEDQVDAHQSALNLMQRYAEDGDVAAIKAFAVATAPKIQQHLDRARAIRDGLK